MKTKGFNKKLSLNKHTVSNLNQNDMGGVNGGKTGETCFLIFPTEYTVLTTKLIVDASVNRPSMKRSCHGWC